MVFIYQFCIQLNCQITGYLLSIIAVIKELLLLLLLASCTKAPQNIR
jgi:hypothetical protein